MIPSVTRPLLFELEAGGEQLSVDELHLKLPARARPALLGLPHVDVLVGERVVRQAAFQVTSTVTLGGVPWMTSHAGSGII